MSAINDGLTLHEGVEFTSDLLFRVSIKRTCSFVKQEDLCILFE